MKEDESPHEVLQIPYDHKGNNVSVDDIKIMILSIKIGRFFQGIWTGGIME